MARRATAAALALVLLVASASASVPAWARAAVERRELLGTSVRGRAIHVWELGVASTTTVLVIGCVHGDECAGVKIADLLLDGEPASFVDLWVVRNLNPDGRAAGTRGKAKGVDLNRNFPYGWEPLPRRRDYSGPR